VNLDPARTVFVMLSFEGPEVAAGGLAVTGAMGEDYAEAYRNSLVLETDDPIEIVTGHGLQPPDAAIIA
jgi:hypothetical protein